MKKVITIIGIICMLVSLTACESPQQRQYNYEHTSHEETSNSETKQYVILLTNRRTIEIKNFSNYSNSERVKITFKNPEVFTRTIKNADGFYENVPYTATEMVTSFQNVVILTDCFDT